MRRNWWSFYFFRTLLFQQHSISEILRDIATKRDVKSSMKPVAVTSDISCYV